jgi:cellulose synthase operon protein C
MKSQTGAKTPQAVIQTTQRIPTGARQQLEARSDYWAEMALAYYDTKQPSMGDRALQKAMAVASSSDNADALNARLEIAGALMKSGQTLRAIDIYEQASQAYPANSAAWEGLVGAYIRMNDFPRARMAVRTMPQDSYDAATRNSDFLSAIAAIYSAQGQCGEAEDFLNRSLDIDKAAGRLPSEITQLQLADIWMRERNYQRAGQQYRQVITKDANSAEAWRGYITALHNVQDDRAAVAETRSMPAPILAQLEKDANFLTLLASAESATGEKDQEIQLLQQAQSVYRAQGQPAPVGVDIELAWTMLDSEQHEQDLREIWPVLGRARILRKNSATV